MITSVSAEENKRTSLTDMYKRNRILQTWNKLAFCATLTFYFSFFLCCCTSKRHICTELDRIESLIMDNPTYASSVLDSLYTAEHSLFTEPEYQARFILLNEYAKYRNGIDEANDSLISISEAYYMQHGSDHERMLCLFLHGAILLYNQNFGPCMQCLSHAADIASRSNNYFMLGQINTNLSLLCSDIYNADAVLYASRALEAYKKHGDLSYIMDGHVNLAIAYYNNRDYNNCEKSLESSFLKAKELNDELSISKCLRYKMYLHVDRQEWKDAISSFVELKGLNNYFLGIEDYSYIAIAHAGMHQRDSSEYYLRNAFKKKYDIVDNELLYLKSAQKVYEKLSDYTLSTDYAQKYQIKRDSIYWARLKNSVMREQYVIVQQKLNSSESTILNLSYIVVLLGLTIVPIILWGYINRLRRKRERERVLYFEKMERLRNEAYKNSARLLKQSSIAYEFKQNCIYHKVTTDKQWQELNSLFAENLSEFENRLNKDERLSEFEWKIAQLIKLDFTTDEIAFLTNRAASSVSSSCNRLSKQRIDENAGAREWREYITNL